MLAFSQERGATSAFKSDAVPPCGAAPSIQAGVVVQEFGPIVRPMDLQYPSEITRAQWTASAHYLFDEGFIEFAEGRMELERL
jgi:hypothetical protein